MFTLIPVGARRFLNESVWMIGSWVHGVCPRRQRRSHVHAALWQTVKPPH